MPIILGGFHIDFITLFIPVFLLVIIMFVRIRIKFIESAMYVLSMFIFTAGLFVFYATYFRDCWLIGKLGLGLIFPIIDVLMIVAYLILAVRAFKKMQISD